MTLRIDRRGFLYRGPIRLPVRVVNGELEFKLKNNSLQRRVVDNPYVRVPLDELNQIAQRPKTEDNGDAKPKHTEG